MPMTTQQGRGAHAADGSAQVGARVRDDDEVQVREVLAHHPPFDTLSAEMLDRLAAAATVRRYPEGALVLDAFADPSPSVYVVLRGEVGQWHEVDRIEGEPDEIGGPGTVFGFSAMLSERSVGPRAVAVTDAVVARLPDAEAAQVFATGRGARFLARSLSTYPRRSTSSAFGSVGEVLRDRPLVVDPETSIADVARAMTDRKVTCAVLELPDGDFGIVNDAIVRRRVVVDGVPTTAPASQIALHPAPLATIDDPAADVFVRMLAADESAVVVTDARGRLQGVATLRDVSLSPLTLDVSIHDQIRRTGTPAELVERSHQVPDLLAGLLSQGMSSQRVIGVYSVVIDTIVRRALELAFEAGDVPMRRGVTYLLLGSNGRREAVLSSDIDSAVVFPDGMTATDQERHRAVFAQVQDLLHRAGLTGDDHGVTASRAPFSRTEGQWRAAARRWLNDPVEEQGAMMTSLLLDSRALYGEQGELPVAQVFRNVHSHRGTLRLLLQDALSVRPRTRGASDALLLRRPADFDIKRHALLPLVNLARWVALNVESSASSTPDRLRAAAGTPFLPDALATTLVEVFEVLQRLRLHYQLQQRGEGRRASDHVAYSMMSPIDRSIVSQAVREIGQAQRRLANVAAYSDSEEWARP